MLEVTVFRVLAPKRESAIEVACIQQGVAAPHDLHVLP
jgi:hypothetical protein